MRGQVIQIDTLWVIPCKNETELNKIPFSPKSCTPSNQSLQSPINSQIGRREGTRMNQTLTLTQQLVKLLPSQSHTFRRRSFRPWAATTLTSKSPFSTMASTGSYTFGPYKIHSNEVFYSTQLSYAMVNLRPLLPGHVLVCPKREVKRFTDLTAEETCDLWLTAQKVGNQLEHHHNASSLTLAIQDGPQAGQTVPHVHIHILPRKGGDFQKNDEIYDAIDVKEKELKDKLDLDIERKDRSLDEMAEEADIYRKLFL